MQHTCFAVLAACCLILASALTPTLATGFDGQDAPIHGLHYKTSSRSLMQDGAATARATSFAASIVASRTDSSQLPTVADSLLASLDDGSGTDSVAAAFLDAGRQDTAAASQAYIQTALSALRSGRQQRFASSVARAFTLAKSQGSMRSYVNTLAGAINGAGSNRPQLARSVGVAMAQATATAGGQQAVAEAVAVAVCEGDGTATAVAEALAVAVTINPNGCATISVAFARAEAQCGPGFARASSQSFATSFTTCKVNPFGGSSTGGDDGRESRGGSRIDRVRLCSRFFGNSRGAFLRCLQGGSEFEQLVARLSSSGGLTPFLTSSSGSDNGGR